MDSPTYITIATASAISGVPEPTLRRWIATDALQVRPGDEEQLVRLDDVRRVQERTARLSGEHARPLEGTVVAPNDLMAPERSPTPSRHDGIALVGALVGAMIGKLDALYSEALTAKDHQLAAKDELIVELRRQVRQAERDAEAPGGAGISPAHSTGSADVPSVPGPRPHAPVTNASLPRWSPSLLSTFGTGETPALPVGTGETPALSAVAPVAPGTGEQRSETAARPVAPTTIPGRPRANANANARTPRWRRQFLLSMGLVVCGVVALNIALTRVSNSPAAPHVARPGATQRTRPAGAPALVPVTGVPLVARRALGAVIGLNAPRAAVMLPDGDIAVADTGAQRLALIDGAGRLLRGEQDGRLREPVAIVVAAGKILYILDAERGAIERYDATGRFVREVARNAMLRGASGMALGRHGLLYIANPRLHAVVVMLSVTGKIERLIDGPLGASDHFVSPIDVGVGADDKLYVLDSGSGRIVALTSGGRLVARWPIVPVATGALAHLLPLPDGRVLLSDASGAVVIYDKDSALPAFKRALTLTGGRSQAHGPLGLSRAPHGDILVTDTRGNRLARLRLRPTRCTR